MTFHILGIIIPTDELIFFRGIETTNQRWFMIILPMIIFLMGQISWSTVVRSVGAQWAMQW
jgi:hypothetical protein